MRDDFDALEAFADSALGAGLPDDAAADIAAAGRLRGQGSNSGDSDDQALALLQRARAAAPDHPAPLIALYRFHFYGHRLALAREAGEQALTLARTALGAGFGVLPPSREAVRFDAAVRFYLFALKGLAYLNLRLGDADAARAQLAKLRYLDPEDCVGGALLAHVLARHERLAAWSGDDEDAHPLAEDEAYTAHPARGWASVGVGHQPSASGAAP